jgi:hypothetical protein
MYDISNIYNCQLYILRQELSPPEASAATPPAVLPKKLVLSEAEWIGSNIPP